MDHTSWPTCNSASYLSDGALLDFTSSPREEEGAASTSLALCFSSNFGPHILPTGRPGLPLCSITMEYDPSLTSSNFDPHRPTFNQPSAPSSTLFDSGSSFASLLEAVPFDFAPTSSATPVSFPTLAKTDNGSNSVFPVVPLTQEHDFFDQPRDSCGFQPDPMRFMGHGRLVSLLSSNSHPSIPSVVTRFDHPSPMAHWTCLDSPITFDPPSSLTLVPAVGSLDEADQDTKTVPATPASTKSTLTGELRNTTSELQEQSRKSPSSSRQVRVKREARLEVVLGETSFVPDILEPETSFICPVEGCPKLYRRNEHVKRHVQT